MPDQSLTEKSACRWCGWDGWDYRGESTPHPSWCLSRSNSKAARIARIVSPNGSRAFDLGHDVAWLREEREALANARSLSGSELYTPEELAHMIASHEANIREARRRIVDRGREIAEVVG